NNPGADVIAFVIGTQGSQQTIVVTAAMPTLVDAVLIDGWTQGGAGYTGPPLIEVDGGTAGVAGFWALVPDITVRGLAINGFNDGAIILDTGATNGVVVGNYIGTRLDGTTANPNLYGIGVKGDNDTIGG